MIRDSDVDAETCDRVNGNLFGERFFSAVRGAYRRRLTYDDTVMIYTSSRGLTNMILKCRSVKYEPRGPHGINIFPDYMVTIFSGKKYSCQNILKRLRK